MARAARAWVSEILPAPVIPMCVVIERLYGESGLDLLRGRYEGLIVGFGVGGSRDLREEQDPVTEGGALVGLQREVQCRGFAVGEDFWRERVGGEEAVAACV